MTAVTRIVLLLLAVLALTNTTSAGDLYNPTKYNDCHIYSTPTYQSTSDQLRKEASLCNKVHKPSGSRSSPNWIGAFQTTCSGSWSRQCGPVLQRYCDYKQHATRQYQACMVRLEEYRRDKTALKERQKKFQEEQARTERERRERLQASQRQQREDFNQIQKYKDSSLVAGVLSGRALTGALPTANGSFYLSNAVSQIGTRFIANTNANAFWRLQNDFNAFGRPSGERFVFSDTSPYPTRSQLNSSNSRYTELRELLDHIEESDHQLPFGNKSAVNSTQARLLTEIVKARVAGTITGDLTDALANWAQTQISGGGQRSIDGRKISDTEKRLRERRLVIMRQFQAQDAAEAERKRQKDLELKREEERTAKLQEEVKRNTENTGQEASSYWKMGRHKFHNCMKDWDSIKFDVSTCPKSLVCDVLDHESGENYEIVPWNTPGYGQSGHWWLSRGVNGYGDTKFGVTRYFKFTLTCRV